MKILLKGFTALLNLKLKKDVSILIEDGIIKKVSKGLRTNTKADKVIEGENKLVMPGFVNAHTHLAMVLLRGLADDLPLKRWLEERIWPAERKLSSEDVYWGSLLGIVEMIRSGTTAFADMYFYMDEVAKAALESGMRALLAYGIIAPEYNAKAGEEIKKGLDLVERWHQEKGRIRVALGPHAPYTCAAKVWQEVTKEAKKYDIMIHTHLAETEDEVRLYENKGKQDSPVKYLESLGVFSVPLLAAHCVHLGDEDIEILSKRGVNVAHNPTSNLKLGSGIAPIEKLLDKEVNVAVGTDGAASNNSLDMMEEIKLAALLPKLRDPSAVPAPLALKMGTQNGALALGFEDVGVIREGMKADLIILNLDKVHLIPQHNLISNIVYSAWAGDVETVIIDGQVVMEEGKILTIDEEEVKNRVRGLSRKFS